MTLLSKFVGFVVGLVIAAAILAAVVAATTGLIILSALPVAAVLWASWIFSGEALTGLQVGFIEMWAGTVFVASLRNIAVHGIISKELAQRAAKKAAEQ